MQQLEFNFSFKNAEWDWIEPEDRKKISALLWEHFLEELWKQGGDIRWINQYFEFHFYQRGPFEVDYAIRPDEIIEAPVRRMTAQYKWCLERDHAQELTRLRVIAHLLPFSKGEPFLIFTKVRYPIFRGGRIEGLVKERHEAMRAMYEYNYGGDIWRERHFIHDEIEVTRLGDRQRYFAHGERA